MTGRDKGVIAAIKWHYRQARLSERGAGNYAAQGGCEDGSSNPYTDNAKFHRDCARDLRKLIVRN